MRPAVRSSAARVGALVLAVAASLATATPAAAQCGGTQLCAAGSGDCTVSAACTITLPAGGLLIDLGSRRLVVTSTLTINGAENVGITIKAGDVLIDGGTIVAPGANGTAGSITILSATNFTLRNGGIIDVSASSSAGFVDLEALAGDLSFTGRIRANGDLTRNGYGGDVSLFATGSVSVSGNGINVTGGDMAGGGSISIEGNTGTATIAAPLQLVGGDGGDVDVTAGTILQTTSLGAINLNANGDAGSAGSVDLSSDGDLTVGGTITGTGSLPWFQTDGLSGGDGADVDAFSASGKVTIAAAITSNAAGGGSGGTVDLDAWLDLSLTDSIFSESGGSFGLGGDVFLTAGGAVSVGGKVSVAGNSGSGGSVEMYASGNLTVSKLVNADADLQGGSIFGAGCAVSVTSNGVLSARGPGSAPSSTVELQASSTTSIAGIIRSTSGNTLEYRSTVPTITGTVTPAALKVLNPNLPCCVSCPVTTTTTSTTTTSLSASTSSTIAGSTSTSTSTTTTTVASVCGDGIKSGAEQCDDHNTAAGDCCSPTCTFEAASSSCADDGNPCTSDVCNGAGACTHPAGNAGTVCRAAAGVCDQAESCNGTSASCPADVKRTDVCRPAAGVCDVAESCNGTSNSCPPDAFAPATTTCRTVAGVCDRAETCTGTSASCPADQLAPAGTTCRAAAGVCDVAETCTGTSSACPADGFLPNGTTCAVGDACNGAGTCQSGACSGAGPVTCGPCETCDPVKGCVVAPNPVCRGPVIAGKARLKLKNSLAGPRRDIVQWKWLSGAATALQDFGNPVTTDAVTLCIFDDATSSLLFRATVPAGGTCGTRPCWSGSSKAFKFSSATGAPDGIAKMSLIPGGAGDAKVLVKARGTALSQRPYELPTPPMPMPFTVQLQSDNGQCWGATYTRAGTHLNDDQTFVGTGE